MPNLCAAVRERWPALRIHPDRALAVGLLLLLAVVMGRQWPALLHGWVPGQGVQQVALDDDYVFDD